MTAGTDRVTETPLYFVADGERLFGVLADPSSGRSGPTVVLAAGGWYGTSADRNRSFVRMSRELAVRGVACLRFDYHGVGESTGDVARFRLEDPFTADLEAALDTLILRGHHQFLLAGVCFGARTCLRVAARRTDVAGLFLISTPVAATEADVPRVAGLTKDEPIPALVLRALRPSAIRGLTDPAVRRTYRKAGRSVRHRLFPRRGGGRFLADISGLDHGFAEPFSGVVGRMPVVLLFGEGDSEYAGFRSIESDRLAAALLATGPIRPQVQVLTSPVLGFSRINVQDEVTRRLVEFASPS